ncbi:branched-chain amino acid ABC transporter substrate-binding protein [Desulfovibrio intestinalis]|uniref:Branched-chain amino acid transport system substrate-binding protein n=1 Tax=Desulfovibrio intestinalis TaxID=58621 RepID=A0A7W8FGC5_9BACT|nr:branched-chain amino acid ABC transporter substrate-binding protein [Desulfovibrio intestinalis]MBB5142667.1 branched-chain amino acid transport system substrate-binding protein [Desulfovibrio intestinalis]
MKKGMTWLAAMAVCVTLAAPAQAADPIKIGVQGAQSGDLASYGVPSLNAVKIVVDEANAKGGLLGRTIEVVAQDDQCKPEMATNAATKLISDKVDAVVGPICSGPTKASLPMFQEAALIAVSPTATTPGLTEDGKNPLFFRTVANDNAQASLTSDFMLNNLKVKKVAYLHDNGDYGKGFADKNREIMEKGGTETVLFEAVTPDAVDFSAVVRKLRRAKPDIIVFGGYQPVASKLLQQMRRDNLKTPLIGPDGVKDETFLKMTGKDSEGTYASYPKDTSTLPEYKKAREAHIKAFGSEPGFGYYNAYAAAQCLLAAMEKAGSTDTAKIKDVLRENQVDTPLGKLSFNAKGDAAGMGLSIYQVKDGKFVELDHSIVLE